MKTLDEMVIELTKLLNNPFNSKYVIEDYLTNNASDLRVALPNNPYTVKYISTNPAIDPSYLASLDTDLEAINKRIYGEFKFYSGSILPKPAVLKCECGSDKLGMPRHSDWCPKHEVDNV